MPLLKELANYVEQFLNHSYIATVVLIGQIAEQSYE